MGGLDVAVLSESGRQTLCDLTRGIRTVRQTAHATSETGRTEGLGVHRAGGQRGSDGTDFQAQTA